MPVEFTVGCDPELFVEKNGVIVSGHPYVSGTKENPTPTNSGAVQVDGVALEFNTKPASTKEGFFLNVSNVLKELRDMIPPDLDFSRTVEFSFDKGYFRSPPRS